MNEIKYRCISLHNINRDMLFTAKCYFFITSLIRIPSILVLSNQIIINTIKALENGRNFGLNSEMKWWLQ